MIEKKQFLCVRSKATPFLIPLALVRHIVPGTGKTKGNVLFEDQEIRVTDFCRLWGEEETEERVYTVLLHHSLGLYGLAVSNVLGVCEISAQEQMAIPEAARGAGNAFIRTAVYADALKGWAFCVDENIVDKTEGLWDDTNGEEQAGSADTDLD